MKKLLTDFSSPRWEGTNNEDIERCFNEVKEKIEKDGCILGELDNPDTFDISLSRVSHTIKNIQMDDNKIYADIQILNTPNGKIAKKLLDDGFDLKMGIRAAGGRISEKKTFNINKGEQIFSELDPYGEENWGDETETIETKKIYIKKIFTWDIISNID